MLVSALDDEGTDSLRVAVRSNAARIHRASTRMHRLITDLLDLSKSAKVASTSKFVKSQRRV